jgi:hypothetical protein
MHMTVQPLSVGAEAVLQTMRLTEPEQNIVRNCVSKYAKPEGFSKQWAWIAYRIATVCKCIFCIQKRTDWDTACEIIYDRITKTILDTHLIQENPWTGLEAKITSTTLGEIHFTSRFLLFTLLRSHEEKTGIDERITAVVVNRSEGVDFLINEWVPKTRRRFEDLYANYPAHPAFQEAFSFV